MSTRPIILGLTGSIGMGKSTVAAMFAEDGVPVFDADAEVHRLQGPGGAALAAIAAAFPGTTGDLSGPRIAARGGDGRSRCLCPAGGDPPSCRAARREAFLQANRDAPLVVLDIPLLFEAGGWAQVDRVAVVSAPADVQRARVLARPGMTEARFEAILARQLPDSEKRARADFVIPTGVPIGETRAVVRDVIACLAGRVGG